MLQRTHRCVEDELGPRESAHCLRGHCRKQARSEEGGCTSRAHQAHCPVTLRFGSVQNGLQPSPSRHLRQVLNTSTPVLLTSATRPAHRQAKDLVGAPVTYARGGGGRCHLIERQDAPSGDATVAEAARQARSAIMCSGTEASPAEGQASAPCESRGRCLAAGLFPSASSLQACNPECSAASLSHRAWVRRCRALRRPCSRPILEAPMLACRSGQLMATHPRHSSSPRYSKASHTGPRALFSGARRLALAPCCSRQVRLWSLRRAANARSSWDERMGCCVCDHAHAEVPNQGAPCHPARDQCVLE